MGDVHRNIGSCDVTILWMINHCNGLDSCPTFNGWWLRVAVLEDRLDDVRVIDLGDDTQRSATQIFQNAVAKVGAPKRYPHLAVRPFGRGLRAIAHDARA